MLQILGTGLQNEHLGPSLKEKTQSEKKKTCYRSLKKSNLVLSFNKLLDPLTPLTLLSKMHKCNISF